MLTVELTFLLVHAHEANAAACLSDSSQSRQSLGGSTAKQSKVTPVVAASGMRTPARQLP